jgi:hypothetical protein
LEDVRFQEETNRGDAEAKNCQDEKEFFHAGISPSNWKSAEIGF